MKFSNYLQSFLHFLSEEQAWSSALVCCMPEALSAYMVDTVVVSAHPSAVSLPKELGHVPWALMVQWEILAECLWLYHADEVLYGGREG